MGCRQGSMQSCEVVVLQLKVSRHEPVRAGEEDPLSALPERFDHTAHGALAVGLLLRWVQCAASVAPLSSGGRLPAGCRQPSGLPVLLPERSDSCRQESAPSAAKRVRMARAVCALLASEGYCRGLNGCTYQHKPAQTANAWPLPGGALCSVCWRWC